MYQRMQVPSHAASQQCRQSRDHVPARAVCRWPHAYVRGSTLWVVASRGRSRCGAGELHPTPPLHDAQPAQPVEPSSNEEQPQAPRPRPSGSSGHRAGGATGVPQRSPESPQAGAGGRRGSKEADSVKPYGGYSPQQLAYIGDSIWSVSAVWVFMQLLHHGHGCGCGAQIYKLLLVAVPSVLLHTVLAPAASHARAPPAASQELCQVPHGG